jgi:DNA-binding transcriptional LysR family regulator
VTLTGEGRRFYEEVKPHLDAIEDAAVVASGAASAVRGRLKVDIDSFFLPLVLAGRLGAFCELYPELAIEFVTSEHVGDLVSDGIDLAIRFGQPRFSTLVSRKLIEAPILTLAPPRYLERYGKPAHPSDLTAHRCPQFLDPHTGRPFEWEFIRGEESIEVPTSGPLTFTDPTTMIEECFAGTGIAQVVGWGLGRRWREARWSTCSRTGTASAFRSSLSIHRASTLLPRSARSSTSALRSLRDSNRERRGSARRARGGVPCCAATTNGQSRRQAPAD